jgi:two-component system, cell cycle sensor histidine kinase and response regulator CckA
VIRKDGTILSISLSATAIKDEAGEFLMSRSVIIDIRERQAKLCDRKQLEAERQLAELALQQQIARKHLLAEMTQAIQGSLDVELILHTAVEQMREFLQIERVIIFRFQPDWSGKVVAEAVVIKSMSILETEITDPCFGERYVEPYCQGRVSAIADFNTSDVEPCHRELMTQFQVRANLVVPILRRGA